MADTVALNQFPADDLHSTKSTLVEQKWSHRLSFQEVWQLPNYFKLHNWIYFVVKILSRQKKIYIFSLISLPNMYI